MIILGIPTLTGAERVRAIVEDVVFRNADVHRFVIVDNGHQGLGEARWLSELPVDTHVVTPPMNLGVAASWNLMLREAAERHATLIVANDDVTFTPSAIGRLADRVDQNAQGTRFLVSGPRAQVFSFWAVNARLAVREVGYFDEQFYPAYYEDNDYEHRMRLAGWSIDHVPPADLGFAHTGGQTTKDLDPARQAWLRGCHERSGRLYRAKWGGGPPLGELFEKPYDPSTLRGFR